MTFGKENYTKLFEALEQNKLIIFVGAGLSFELINSQDQKIGAWKELLKAILNNFKEKIPQFSSILEKSDLLSPIKILEDIGELVKTSYSIDKDDIKTFAKNYFSLGQNNFVLQKSISKLTDKIITTNYDLAFETANPNLKRNVAILGRNFEISKLKESYEFLFKIHGCISQMDSLVLFSDEYSALYESEKEDPKHIVKALENLIYNNTILFIGCGMGDNQINHFFKELKRIEGQHFKNHFIISKDVIDSEKDFLNHIKIENYKEIEDIITILNLEKNKILEKKINYDKEIESLKNELSKLKSSHKVVIIELFDEANAYFFKKDYENQIKNYGRIIKLEPVGFITVFSNWGNALHQLGLLKNDIYFFEESIEKYKRALNIEPNFASAYFNWGNALTLLGEKAENIEESQNHFFEAFEKYKKANYLWPFDFTICHGWANSLSFYANKFESDYYFRKSFEMYAKAEKLVDKIKNNGVLKSDIYINLGKTYCNYAILFKSNSFFNQAIGKFKKATELDSYSFDAFLNWGKLLLNIGKNETTLLESIEKLNIAINLNPHFGYSHEILGQAFLQLGLKTNLLEHFLQSSVKFEIAEKLIIPTAQFYNNWAVSLTHLGLINKSENYFIDSFSMYEKGLFINPKDSNIYHNWGVSYQKLSEINNDSIYLNDALHKYKKAVELGYGDYVLAQFYASIDYKANALKFLKLCINEKSITKTKLLNDLEWRKFENDLDFIEILNTIN